MSNNNTIQQKEQEESSQIVQDLPQQEQGQPTSSFSPLSLIPNVEREIYNKTKAFADINKSEFKDIITNPLTTDLRKIVPSINPEVVVDDLESLKKKSG